jgi:TrkA-N domain.
MATIRNSRESLISGLARMEPSHREILLASLSLLVLFVIGTVGSVLLEGWTVVDGLYMTFIICGHGRVGKRLAEDLHRAGTPIVVADIDEEAVSGCDSEARRRPLRNGRPARG